MATPNLQAVECKLELATGLDFEVKGATGAEGFVASVRPLGFEHLHGFVVEVSVGWRSVLARFVPDTFAGDIMTLMSASEPMQRAEFSTLAEEMSARGSLRLELDRKQVDLTNSSDWPARWDDLRLEMEQGPLEVTASNVDGVVADSALAVTSLVLTLLPVEVSDDPRTLLGQEEGRAYETRSKRYERSPANRAACVSLKGSRCLACGLDLGEVYGPLGDGYIEVHHAIPVAQMPDDYVVDISADLFPLCPNCHAMVHREDPPIPVHTLAERLRRSAQNR